MTNLVQTLRQFNRKERFFLVGLALGNRDFRLSDGFRGQLEHCFKLKIPRDAFCAMDYHFDWFYASLVLHCVEDKGNIFKNDGNLVSANQEDIDLIVAFQQDGTCHILLIEAKGVTGWSNSQLNSKAKRFAEMLEQLKKHERFKSVALHFCIISPVEPKGLATKGWPDWMCPNGTVPWLELPSPEVELKRVSRCNPKGKPDARGKHWTVIEEKRWAESAKSKRR